MIKKIWLTLLGLTLCAVSHAQTSAVTHVAQQAEKAGAPMAVITPVFSQLVRFTYPAGFRPAHEQSNANQYIQESVLTGETVQKWTQMITLTGFRDVANKENISPAIVISGIAGLFQKACPNSFTYLNGGPNKIDGYDAHVAILSCGLDAQPYPHSETTLILAIKGAKDVYTLQWAERGAPSDKALNINPEIWKQRLGALSPVRLCQKQPGEKPPYPSCGLSR